MALTSQMGHSGASSSKSALSQEAQVMRLFREGAPCSAIDAALGYPEGHAHDLVVRFWFKNKEKSFRGR